MYSSSQPKQKKVLKPIFVLCFGLLLVGLAIYAITYFNKKPTTTNSQNQTSTNTVNQPKNDGLNTDDPASQYIIVNKKRPISLNYIPSDLITPNIAINNQKNEAENSVRKIISQDLEAMFADAKNNNLNLMLASGYRSAEQQSTYYNNLVQTLGQQEADRVSAKPGTSEHQTGLSLDISPTSRECYLEACFAQSPEGIWLKDNAYRYGFILRYPQGKEQITGYQFEPWHFRYVGKDLAQKIYTQNKTLEEYFNL